MKMVIRVFSAALALLLTVGTVSETAYGISARSAAVIDAASGRVLYEKDGDTRAGMASTTKIMTAICAIENKELDSLATVSANASGVEGSSMYLIKGERLTLSDLLYGLMLVSGNDAATAVAEHVSGSVEKFVKLMNETALEIGAYNSHFTNPHGLSDAEHYTTALDLAKISAYAMKNPTFAKIVSTKSQSVPWKDHDYNRRLVNHNKFLSMYDGCIGIKTGFTKATGRCLVTAVERDGMRLICVTLNAPDDWNDHRDLYNSAFAEFKQYTVKPKGEVMCRAEVKKGEARSVELICADNVKIPIREGEEGKISIKTEPFEGIEAPVKKGDVLGKMILSIDNKPCGELPLCAKNDVAMKRIVFKAASGDFAVMLKKVFLAWTHCFTD